MRKQNLKKTFRLSSQFLITRQKTFQAHLGAKRNSPIATGENTVKQVLPNLPTCWTHLQYVLVFFCCFFFFFCRNCYSAQVDMPATGSRHEGAVGRMQSVTFGCFSALRSINRTTPSCGSTLETLSTSNVLFSFGLKQHKFCQFCHRWKDINLYQTRPLLVEKSYI